MYLAYVRDQLEEDYQQRKNQEEILYSPQVIYKVILSGVYTLFIGANTLYLNPNIPTVPFWLLFLSFLRVMLLLLIF